jgi:hypothetical protein
MTIRSNLKFRRPAVAAAALAAAIAMSSIPARAEAMLSSRQVEHIIEASGYEVVGPVVRHGSTYVADVVGEGDISEEFVIDAHDGRLLHRSRVNSAPSRHLAAPYPSSGLTGFFDTLFGGADVTPLPPPPADDFSDKPRPKLHVRRPATASAPAAQPLKATPATSTAPSPAPVATSPNPEPHPPETGTAPPAAPASSAPPKTTSAKPNDVQVAPLE